MSWTDERLAATLDSLAADLDWPDATRPLPSCGQRSRLGSDVPVVGGPVWSLPPSWSWLLLSAPGQEAVAWLLRISGIRVELTETSVPMSPPRKLIDEVEVTLAEAEAAVGFDLLLPERIVDPRLGATG